MTFADGRTNDLAAAIQDAEMSSRSQPSKVLSYASVPQNISPIILGAKKDVDDDDGFFSLDRPRQHRANLAKRLSGRSARLTESPSLLPSSENRRPGPLPIVGDSTTDSHLLYRGRPSLLEQIIAWLEEEKAKNNSRRGQRHTAIEASTIGKNDGGLDETGESTRRASNASDHAPALEKLEHIIETALRNASTPKSPGGKHSNHVHRTSSCRKSKYLLTNTLSDNDVQDSELIVPSCEAWLDNTRTLSFSGGSIDPLHVVEPSKSKSKDPEAWFAFKFEILRLIHTLHIKGWRRVALECSCDINVEKLSGALTNSIYAISPPTDSSSARQTSEAIVAKFRKPPPKLLLRIYGPNVSHLIDRESELAILRRLARKRIGPRLLGTFTNGRFEEYFNARPLTPQDLRHPETSKQIAKRMKELHDGIALEEREINAGPFVWQNWDKWVARCGKIVKRLDQQSLKEAETSAARTSRPSTPLFVCGVEWEKFRDAVDKYKDWLESQYGGRDRVKERLVFAHNDTQYGNILRHVPQGDSPLLLPANEHKQLVVIDFEYANANVPGLEFANHFTEWCYNYHDEQAPHALNDWAYPSPSEQARFLRSYVCHQPQTGFNSSPLTTPRFGPTSGPTTEGWTGIALSSSPMPSNSATALTPRTPSLPHSELSTSSSNMSIFSLDSRTPSVHSIQTSDSRGGPDWSGIEGATNEATEEEVKRLMHETRLWRAANSAQWVAWGIVQAKLPRTLAKDVERSLADEDPHKQEHNSSSSALEPDLKDTSLRERPETMLQKQSDVLEESGLSTGEQKGEQSDEEEEGEFDYLAYAHERALLFWGDMIQAGFVSEKELPERLRARVKILEY
ncbi:MAG: hypothetical protein M1821_009860 [Bathelium mastoideum]|nr:MAG: hypothetical protein M1821_009860 [Bathelium mastoideum]